MLFLGDGNEITQVSDIHIENILIARHIDTSRYQRRCSSVEEVTEALLYTAVRTPFGRFNGALADTRPDDLAAAVIRAALTTTPELDPAAIDEVVWGNANGAGEENRNVGRMAALLAGVPVSVAGTTVNRLCGSGLDAAMIGSRQIETGDATLVLTGGVESMTRAPWVLPKPGRAFPAGDATLVSTTLGWRLVNPRMPAEWTVSLGEANEQLAERFSISRERQDAFALRSHTLAAAAWADGFYDDLVAQVEGVHLLRDEGIRTDTTAEKVARLKPSFRHDGTITAGNASPLSDGASAVLLGSVAAADLVGTAPVARIAGRGAHAVEPQSFGYAPVEAANRALTRAGIGWDQVGAVELNEAFAVQSLACVDAWKIDPEIVNTRGGAIAIGHPLGASGGRILGTLTKVLRERNERWGVAAICIGVGQGLAVVVENLEVTR
ncbi:thiolase family protein [Nocardia nova]